MAGGTLSKRAGIFISAQFDANAIGIVTSMVLARLLSKESVGNYLQLMLVYGFFSQLVIMGLPSSLTYFYPTVEDKHKATTVYVVVGGLLISGVLMGMMTYFGAPFIARYFGDERLMPLIRRFCLFYAFTVGNSYMRRFLVSTNRYRFLMFWMPFDRTMNMLSFAVPALLGYDLMVMVTVAVITSGFQFIVAVSFTARVISPLKFVWKSDLVRRILLYSLPIGLSAASGKISRSIDRLVVGYFESTEFFATFSWAARSLPDLSIIAASVMTVLIPELARLHKEENYRQFAAIWHESIRKIAIFVLAIFAFLMFMAGPYIVTLYSEQYTGSVIFFRIYLLGLLMRVTMFGYVMQAIGRPRYILYATLGSLTLKSFLSVGMYKLFAMRGYGPMGPPVASLVMASALGVFYLHIIAKKLDLSARQVWPWREYGTILLAAMAAGGVASVTYLIPDAAIASVLAGVSGSVGVNPSFVSLARLAMASAAFVPVYGMTLQLTGLIRPKDWQLLKDVTIGRFLRK